MKDSVVIFDFGNVVLSVDHMIACRKLAEECGLDEGYIYRQIFESGLERRFDEGKVTGEQFFRQCSEAIGVDTDLPMFKETWSDIFSENEDVIEIIREVKKNSRVFLLSNTNQWHIEYISRHFDVLGLFDKVIFSYRVGVMKPDKRIFERAIELSGGSSERVYIDDIKEYAEAAKEAGLDGICFTDAGSLRKELCARGLLSGE